MIRHYRPPCYMRAIPSPIDCVAARQGFGDPEVRRSRHGSRPNSKKEARDTPVPIPRSASTEAAFIDAPPTRRLLGAGSHLALVRGKCSQHLCLLSLGHLEVVEGSPKLGCDFVEDGGRDL